MACALRCPRRYYYDNILGLKLKQTSEALRIGTAGYRGVALVRTGSQVTKVAIR